MAKRRTKKQETQALEWIAVMRKQLGPVSAPKRWKRDGILSESELRKIAAAEAEWGYEEYGMKQA